MLSKYLFHKESMFQLPYLFLRKSGEPQHWSSPPAMIAMRSPSRSASSMKCVVRRMVRPRFSPCSRSHVARLADGSMPEVGSSSITTYKIKTSNHNRSTKRKQHHVQFRKSRQMRELRTLREPKLVSKSLEY